MGKYVIFGSIQVVFPSNRALYITSIGWVVSMTLGVVLVTLSFLHRLVTFPVPMEPLSMPPMSQSCPSLHVESMIRIFSHHFPYSLVRRKFSLSRPFLNYLDFACQPFPIQLLDRGHLIRLISSTLSSSAEYLVLVDGDALIPSF